MVLYGTEYKMRFTVRAQRELKDLCPGKSLDNLGELLDAEDYDQRLDNMYLICNILIRGYNAFAKYVLKTDSECQEMDKELFEVLDPVELVELLSEITGVINGDRRTTIEAEAPKN